jgi:hypothetical protein
MQASQQTGDQAQLNCILVALQRLLLDPNKRVREAAQTSLALLTEASGEKRLPQVPLCAFGFRDSGGSACGYSVVRLLSDEALLFVLFQWSAQLTGCLECYCKAGELSEVSTGALVVRCSRRAEFQDVPLGYLLRVGI